ncbi:MAG TPA: hypothetical protein VFI96_01295 [Longimicrobiaceae bacterium]|nr:hypothetical protein [Longimicrobiaceae bacterium]
MTAELGWTTTSLALALALLAAPTRASAQDPALSAGGSLDLATSYVWRGMQIDDDVNVQPSLWLDYGPFELGTWGSHSFDDYHEQDFWLTFFLPEWKAGSLALTLNDYYVNSDFGSDFADFSGVEDCPADEGFGNPPRCATGPHTLEVMGAFTTAAVPLTFTLAYNFHNDPENATYAEAAFTPSLAGFDLGLVAGGTLGESAYYYGTNGSAFTNLTASVGRTPTVGRFSIPVVAQVTSNPAWNETFYVLRVGVAADF